MAIEAHLSCFCQFLLEQGRLRHPATFLEYDACLKRGIAQSISYGLLANSVTWHVTESYEITRAGPIRTESWEQGLRAYHEGNKILDVRQLLGVRSTVEGLAGQEDLTPRPWVVVQEQQATLLLEQIATLLRASHKV